MRKASGPVEYGSNLEHPRNCASIVTMFSIGCVKPLRFRAIVSVLS